jgi:hypothetical protein
MSWKTGRRSPVALEIDVHVPTNLPQNWSFAADDTLCRREREAL